jgi:hypothetical protein
LYFTFFTNIVISFVGSMYFVVFLKNIISSAVILDSCWSFSVQVLVTYSRVDSVVSLQSG